MLFFCVGQETPKPYGEEEMPDSMDLVLEESPKVEHAFVLSDEAAEMIAEHSLKMLRLDEYKG